MRDTEFIKMCEKAIKIQEGWEPTIGDFSIYKPYSPSLEFSLEIIRHDDFIKTDSYIWLPRQDQLQKMVLDEYSWFNVAPGHFQSIYHAIIWDFQSFVQCCDFKTCEQLWLAFVMKKKFNKTWNGKDWIDNK